MVVIAAFGNPLLDITVKIADDALLNKYNLKEDDQKEIPVERIKSLLNEISLLSPVVTAGGAAQNTMRILQWILEKPESTIMFGAVGQDDLGKKLKTIVEEAGVKTRYIENPIQPTGTVIALVNGADRSLVAYIGAAQYVTIEDIHGEDIKMLNKVDLVYMEGFFLTNREQFVKYILEFCYDTQLPFMFNLSAVYIVNDYTDTVMHFAKQCDILIGNCKEYEALIKAAKLTIDTKTLLLQLNQNYDNFKNLKYGKIVIMTNSSKSVICAHSNGQIQEIPVPVLEKEKIGDTTGAGDAFAAGFLAGYFNNRTLTGCLKWGCWSSRQIIQQIGCTIPQHSAESLHSIE